MTIVEQRFRIGDLVQVVPDYRYGEWVGQPLWISGANLNTLNEINYWVADHWPPRHLGDTTDGFSEADLMSRTAPPAEPVLRDLVNRFFSLRLSQKREICERVGLPIGPSNGPDFEQYKGSIIAAKEQGKLIALSEAILAAEAAS